MTSLLLFCCALAALQHLSKALRTAPPRSRAAASALPAVARPQSQFDMFREHVEGGRWLGVQTGYSASDDQVEDYMYVETQYDSEGGGQAIRQTNSIVAAEIRTDCEVCYDSERLKSREVGLFSEGKLRTKHCGNAALTGPAPSPRGLGLELSLRHGDGRCRVLFVYTATDFRDVEGAGAVPCALELTDYIVVRERVGSRPLQLEGAVDALWADPADCPALAAGALLSGEVAQYADGAVDAAAAALSTAGAAADCHRRLLPGRLSIDACRRIEYTAEARLCVHWAPEGAGGPVYSAELRFTALNDVYVGAELRVAPPRITRYAVSSLRLDGLQGH